MSPSGADSWGRTKDMSPIRAPARATRFPHIRTHSHMFTRNYALFPTFPRVYALHLRTFPWVYVRFYTSKYYSAEPGGRLQEGLLARLPGRSWAVNIRRPRGENTAETQRTHSQYAANTERARNQREADTWKTRNRLAVDTRLPSTRSKVYFTRTRHRHAVNALLMESV